MTSQLERMTSQIVSNTFVTMAAASIMAEHKCQFCGDISIWPKRSYLLAESFTFCGRNVHDIRDVSAKNCGRNGSCPKRPVTLTAAWTPHAYKHHHLNQIAIQLLDIKSQTDRQTERTAISIIPFTSYHSNLVSSPSRHI